MKALQLIKPNGSFLIKVMHDYTHSYQLPMDPLSLHDTGKEKQNRNIEDTAYSGQNQTRWRVLQAGWG